MSSPAASNRAVKSRHQLGVTRGARRLWGTIAVLFALALVARAVPMTLHRLDPERITTVDSARYLDLADRLAAGEGFSLSGLDSSRPPSDERVTQAAQPEIFRTPGYPFVLAFLGKFPGSRDAWVLSLQIFADAVAAVLCFLVVSSWASWRAGVLAGLLYALTPAHIVYANLLMADILCSFSVVLGLTLLESATRRGDERRRGSLALVAAGGYFTLATALRPVVALLFLPAVLFLSLRGRGRRQIAGFVLAALLFPTAWSMRNVVSAGAFTLSSAFDLNLALVAGAKVEARASGLARPVGEARVMARVAERERSGVVPFRQACREVGWETLRGAPQATLWELVASAAEMLLAGERRYLLQVLGVRFAEAGLAEGRRDTIAMLWGLATFPRGERFLVLGQAGFMVAIWAAALFGASILWRRGQRDVALLALLSLVLVLAPSLVVGTGRLRIPVTVFLVALAGIGIDAAARWEFRRPPVR